MSKKIIKSIIVKADRAKVYAAATAFNEIPRFIKGIKSIEETGPSTYIWNFDDTLGHEYICESRMTLKEPYSRIAWQTESGDIKTSGQVTLTELPKQETQITLIFNYELPEGISEDFLKNVAGGRRRR